MRQILHHTLHDQVTAIVTRELTEELALSLPDKDVLDEWNPIWWKQPPPELQSIQPATPHTRITKCRIKPQKNKPTIHTTKLYVLTFTLPQTTGTQQGPDWMTLWYWTPLHHGTTAPKDLPWFYVDYNEKKVQQSNGGSRQ